MGRQRQVSRLFDRGITKKNAVLDLTPGLVFVLVPFFLSWRLQNEKQELARKILEGFFGTKGSKRSCKFPLFNIIKAGVGCSEWAPRCWDYYGEPTRSWSSVS